MAAGGGGEEASESGIEIAGGEVMAGEKVGDFAAELLSGLGLVEFAVVETTEQGMAGLARRPSEKLKVHKDAERVVDMGVFC